MPSRTTFLDAGVISRRKRRGTRVIRPASVLISRSVAALGAVVRHRVACVDLPMLAPLGRGPAGRGVRKRLADALTNRLGERLDHPLADLHLLVRHRGIRRRRGVAGSGAGGGVAAGGVAEAAWLQARLREAARRPGLRHAGSAAVPRAPAARVRAPAPARCRARSGTASGSSRFRGARVHLLVARQGLGGRDLGEDVRDAQPGVPGGQCLPGRTGPRSRPRGRSGPRRAGSRDRPWRAARRGVPCSTISPWFITRIRSALRTVDSRWAIMNEVRPTIRFSSASRITASVLESIAEVGSSRMRIGDARMNARATAIR